jgi:hypothetical protein
MNGFAAARNSCCHPIIEAPAPVSTPSKVQLLDHSPFVAAIVPLPLLLPTVEGLPSFERIHCSTPPPLDAVIAYQHLTI